MEGQMDSVSGQDRFWEELFISGVRKLNEGNQGIILKILPDYRENMPLSLRSPRANRTELPVVKLDKTGADQSGRSEFEMQMRAYEIISRRFVSNTVRVPALWETECHHVLVEDTDALRRNTGLMHGTVEFLAMEEVKGVDLATFAYQQALLEFVRLDTREGYPRPAHALLHSLMRYKLVRDIAFDAIVEKPLRGHMMRLAKRLRSSMLNAGYEFLESWDNEIETSDRDLLVRICPIQREVATLRALQEGYEGAIGVYLSKLLKIPMLERAIIDMRPECIMLKSPEERRRRFVSLVHESVGERGLLPEALCEIGREAIAALHEQGFYHCDLHERNLMVSSDRKTLYLIDFGKSNPNGDASGGAHNYYRYDGNGADDFGILSAPSGLLYLLTRQHTE